MQPSTANVDFGALSQLRRRDFGLAITWTPCVIYTFRLSGVSTPHFTFLFTLLPLLRRPLIDSTAYLRLALFGPLILPFWFAMVAGAALRIFGEKAGIGGWLLMIAAYGVPYAALHAALLWVILYRVKPSRSIHFHAALLAAPAVVAIAVMVLFIGNGWEVSGKLSLIALGLGYFYGLLLELPYLAGRALGLIGPTSPIKPTYPLGTAG